MTPQVPLENGRLGTRDVARYRAQGYLSPVPAVTADQAARWRAELESVERDWITAGLPSPLNSYKRVNAQCVMPLAYEIGAHPAVLDVVEGVLGPDILLYAVEFFIKEPHTTQVITLHQDLTYWGLGEIDGLVTTWIALSPATLASGCMEFVAGSHKNPILPHHDTFDANNLLSRGQEIAVGVAQEDIVAIELAPGQMSLHHGLMIHGSGPNATSDRRIGAVVRYLSPEVALQSGDKDYAIPLRGEDRHGNFVHYAPPSGYFTAGDLATYAKIRARQHKAQAAGAAKSLVYDTEAPQ